MRIILTILAVAAVAALTVSLGVALANGTPRLTVYLLAIPLGTLSGFAAGLRAFELITARQARTSVRKEERRADASGEIVKFRRPPTAPRRTAA